MKNTHPKPSRFTLCLIILLVAGIWIPCATGQTPPCPGGDCGSGTNGPPFLYVLPPYIPGLKLAAAVDGGTNVYLTLLEADPTGKYDVWSSTNLATTIWSNTAQGATGQTNFSFHLSQWESGFFKATRTDNPVTNAAEIEAYFPYEVNSMNFVNALIEGGPAASMAILVNSTNFATARWIPFSAVPVVELGTNEGTYEVWFGFRGSDGQTYWSKSFVALDKTPPTIVITNPAVSSTSRPFIQLQGYSTEALSLLTFDVSNAAGSTTNQQGFVVAQSYDTNTLHVTTNWFHCFDVELTNGANNVTLHAVDLAGNIATTNLTYTLDFSGDTTAPLLTLEWPQSGTHIGGSNVCVRGILDDETASVSALIINTNGTNTTSGMVERNGRFWIDEVPLVQGSNDVIVITTDAAGNSTTTNIVLVGSSILLTIETVSEDALTNRTATVSGTVSGTNYNVWVNGVQATVDGAGNWSATEVPVIGHGAATFDAVAYMNGSEQPAVNQSHAKERPAMIYVYNHTDGWNERFPSIGAHWEFTKGYNAKVDDDGNITYMGTETANGEDGGAGYEWWNEIYKWSDTNQTGTTVFSTGLIGYPPWDESGTNSSWGEHMHLGNSVPATSPQQWNPFIGISHFYANVSHNWGSNEHVYARVSKTYMKIRTGGRAGISRKELFTLDGGATRYGRPSSINWGNAPDEWMGTPMQAIPPASVRVLGKSLGNDGKLHIVLPDNAELELGLSAPARHYGANVQPTKHRFRIIANGIMLTPDHVARGATNCVGQKIILQSVLSPPTEYTDQSVEWLLPALFVNFIEYWSFDAKRYLIDWALTYQQDTHAWWVLGGMKNVGCEWRLTFSNGQKANINTLGKMWMHRPSIVNFTSSPPFFVTITTNLNTLGRPWLLLGEEDSQDGYMRFAGTVLSDFSGSIRWTQLINQYRHRDDYPVGWWTKNTAGQYWADGGEFYVPETLSQDVAPNLPRTLTFGDGPGNPVGITQVQAIDSFKTYLRFRPAGADNIWVTLGRVDWSWNAFATNSLGWPYNNIPSNWTITSSSVPNPSLNGDYEFPFWLGETSSFGDW